MTLWIAMGATATTPRPPQVNDGAIDTADASRYTPRCSSQGDGDGGGDGISRDAAAQRAKKKREGGTGVTAQEGSG